MGTATITTPTATTATQTTTTTTATITTATTTTTAATSITSTTISATSTTMTTTTTTEKSVTLTTTTPTTTNTESDNPPCADDVGCANLQPFCLTKTEMGSSIRALCPVMCGVCSTNVERSPPASTSFSTTTSASTSVNLSTPSLQTTAGATTSSGKSAEPSSISLGNKASKIIISADGENKKLSTGSIIAIIVGSIAFVVAIAIMCRRNACVCNITFGASGHEVAQESDPRRNRTVESFQNPTYENPDAIVQRRFQPRTSRNLVAMESSSHVLGRSPSRLSTPMTPALPPRNNQHSKMVQMNAEQRLESFHPPPYASAVSTITPTRRSSIQPYASTVAAAAAASPTPRRTYFDLNPTQDGPREAEV